MALLVPPFCNSMSCDGKTKCALQASTTGGWQPGLQSEIPCGDRHTRRAAKGASG